MSIRQLSFEEGETLNIRSCTKLPRNTSFEELEQIAKSEDILVVKSGKSYFDVTSKRDIFDQAQEFDLNSLTNIDKRDLVQKNAVPAFSEEKSIDPMAMLYQNTSKENEKEEEILVTKTYRIRLDQFETIKTLRFVEDSEISTIVRELLDMAIAIKSEQHSIDFRAESEKKVKSRAMKKQ